MNFVLEGMEDYIAYESCLTLGLDVDDYAMEAFDFKSMKESVSKKFKEIKAWVAQKWDDVRASFLQMVTKFSGKKHDTPFMQGRDMTKEEKEEIEKSRRYYQALARSEDVVKEGAEKYVSYVKRIRAANEGESAAKQKDGEDYITFLFRDAGYFGNIRDISSKFDELEDFLIQDGTQTNTVRQLSIEYAERAIAEGKRMIKLGDVLMKGPIQQLLAAVAGVMKSSDAEANGAGKIFQFAVAGLNFIGKCVRFIIKVVTLPLRPLMRFFSVNDHKASNKRYNSPKTRFAPNTPEIPDDIYEMGQRTARADQRQIDRKVN